MKKLTIIAVLLSCFFITSGQSIAMLGAIASAGGMVYSFQDNHPITHDQLYIVPSEAVNGDYIGEVHYNCTDSIFNDRSVGSYAWDIVSGNTGTAFAIGAATGLLTVNDAAEIAADFTLGVRITHNTVSDTAICTILYRDDCTYINLDLPNGGSGTRAQPYAINHDYGNYTGGKTVLFKRGSSGIATTRYVYNQTGDYLIFGAYGQGEKPVFLANESANAYVFYAGNDDATDAGNNVNGADSIIAMDLKVYCRDVVDENNCIQFRKNSNEDQFHRIHTVGSGIENAAIFVFSLNNADANHVFKDMQMDSTTDARAIKCHAGGCTGVNIYGKYCNGAFLYFGAYAGTTLAANSWKYLYTTGAPGASNDYAYDVRDANTNVEWFYADNWGIGVRFQNYGYHEPTDISIKNGIITNTTSASYGAISFDWGTDPLQTDPYENINLENILIDGSAYDGINLGVTNGEFININIKNCVIINSDGRGIYARDMVDDVTIQNCIVYGNDSPADDINISDATTPTVTNTIFEVSDTEAAAADNYDYNDGDPFNDKANGDYTTTIPFAEVIDNGTDISQVLDIINNTIGTQDIGPFESGGDKFNWTKRE